MQHGKEKVFLAHPPAWVYAAGRVVPLKAEGRGTSLPPARASPSSETPGRGGLQATASSSASDTEVMRLWTQRNRNCGAAEVFLRLQNML